MTPHLFKRGLVAAGSIALALTFAFGVAGCGGGSDGADDSPPTVRPKTLDGIIMQLDNQVRFEFLKNLSSPAALESGQEETGTFIYTPLFSIVVADEAVTPHNNYQNLAGTTTLNSFPASIGVTRYTYRAINTTSAVLTLTGLGASTWHFGHQVPWLYNDDGTDASDAVQIDLTFSTDGSIVSSNTITLSLPDSPDVSTRDTVRITSKVVLATGGNVPENYNPPVDLNRPSKIAPVSLSGLVLNAKNGIPDSSKDFTIQFVKDGSYTGNPSDSSDPDEIGQGILRVAGSPVDVALDYTYRRIGGTDNADLVLSNIPFNIVQPFLNSLNGSYTLGFLGQDSGVYTGKVDSGTPDAAEVSGTFNTVVGN